MIKGKPPRPKGDKEKIVTKHPPGPITRKVPPSGGDAIVTKKKPEFTAAPKKSAPTWANKRKPAIKSSGWGNV